jgi:hypothetical protein
MISAACSGVPLCKDQSPAISNRGAAKVIQALPPLEDALDAEPLRSIVGEQISLFDGAKDYGKH